MKKTGVLFLFFALLTGCGGTQKEIERAMTLRSSLLQGDGCSFDVKITADYGDEVHIFNASCHGDSAGDLSFTVTQPESIAGITGTVTEENGFLTFDGMALQFAPMAEDLVTPVSAPWLFLKTLRSGYLTSACQDGDLLWLTIDDRYEDNALQLDIWLAENNIPIRAEILHEGRRIVTLDVGNFTIL